MNNKEIILSQIRKKKIKLWLPPYYSQSGQNEESSDALHNLAKSLVPDSSTNNDINEEQVRSILLELQSHALQKLAEKYTVDVKILVTQQHSAALSQDLGSSAAAGWGDSVVIVKEGGGKILLRITNVSPDLTTDRLSADLCKIFSAESPRLIWRGKNLTTSSMDSIGERNIRKLLSCSSKTPNQKKKNEILCIIGSFAPRSTDTDSDMKLAASSSSASASASAVQTDQSVIESIRRAARTMQLSSSGSRFEITDQSGQLVAMSQSDLASFLSALGLHRLGRSRMEILGDISTSSASSSASCASRSDAVASALVFLLEADAEWQNPALENWKQKVDNYGLLQLDIAWCYLLLESLDALPEATRRLDVAEAALKKQVHSNFVTLALAQAEMNNPIPPLCAIFVRLFLLQGVANMMQRGDDDATGAERLGWARLLCNRLRSTCPFDSVDLLSNAYLIDRHTAIAALRRSNGDPDAAGQLITADRDEERRAVKKRSCQRRIGKCSNGTEYPNLDLIPVLGSLLSFDVKNDASEDNYDSGKNEPCMSTLIVVGLLRLSNNSIEKSLELYQELGAEEILQHVKCLDELVGARKRSRESGMKKHADHEVHDVDLTMLISMGVEEARARDALKETGNVETALLWLSKGDGDAADNSEGQISRVSGKKESGRTEKPNGLEVAAASDSTTTTSKMRQENAFNVESHGNACLSREEIESLEAQELLTRELGNAIRDGSKDLEKEWLGADMEVEWNLIERYAGK